MQYGLGRLVLVGFFALAVAACGARSTSFVPAGAGSNAVASPSVQEPAVPKVGGVYNGTVVESSQGRSIKAKLKITLKQTGNKFTGIFDMILKTVQDQFPITKGTVISSHGQTILHFTIEGNPRNAKATARLVGTTLKGKAKVPPRNGPAIRFKYSAKKT